MLITFRKGAILGMGPWHTVRLICDHVSAETYNGNVYASETWTKGNRCRFTLETKDSRAFGSRTSWSGRHMRKASWQAHWDVLEAIFQQHPDAIVRTSMATYDGYKGFLANAPATAEKNIGSRMQPATMPDCTV